MGDPRRGQWDEEDDKWLGQMLDGAGAAPTDSFDDPDDDAWLQASLKGGQTAQPAQGAHPAFIDYQPPPGPQGQQPGPSGVASASEGPSIYEQYLSIDPQRMQQTLGGAQQGIKDFGSNIAEGAQDAVTSLAPRMGGLGGTQPTDAWEEYANQQADAARQRSPIATTGANLAADVGEGAALTAMGMGPVAGAAMQGGLQSSENGENPLKGAAIGGGTAYGIGMLGKGAKAVAPAIEPYADRMRVRSYGASAGDTAGWNDAQFAQSADAGRRLGMPKLAGPGGMRKAAGNIADDLDSQRSGLVDQAREMGADPDPDNLADKIEYLKGAKGSGSEGQELSGQLQTEADRMRGMSRFGGMQVGGEDAWTEMQKERALWRNATDFDATSNKGRVRKDIYGSINDTMSDAANEVDPGLGQRWRDVNSDERRAIEMRDWSNEALNRGTGNPNGRWSDYAVGGAGYAAGGPLGGAAALSANYALRPRATAIGATALEGAGRLAEGMGGMTGQIPGQVANSANREWQESGDRVERQKQAIGESTPSSTLSNINDALISDPSALGPYRGQFESAGRTPEGTKQLLNRLQNDQTWRTQFLPMFQGAR